MATRHEGIVARWYDLVDGVVEGDPADMLSEDFQFEMVYPAMGGAPDERIVGGKEEYKQFRHQLYTRPEGPPAALSEGTTSRQSSWWMASNSCSARPAAADARGPYWPPRRPMARAE
jgi:hypothetical protein